MWGVAILTMAVGSIVALTQRDVKRLLAYSSIAQAGYLLTGVVAANRTGLSGVMFYLAAYGFATIGAFAIVTLVRDHGGEASHLSSWAGLGKRSPLVAGLFALFLIAFAGIPLTSGFTGKFFVFQAAIQGGALPLVIVGAISSAILAFPYVRVIVLMFFSEPATEGPVVVRPSAYTGMAVALGAAATVVLGIVPEPLINLANHAASQLFVR
jgi:NADH-quinone oxidoreductase subunit N